MRAEFAKNYTKWLGWDVGGKPILFRNLGQYRDPPTSSELAHVYRHSIFCPVFPGDNPPQKRFYQALLNGCIPVVPQWPSSSGEAFPSLFGPGRFAARNTYAFHTHTYHGDDAVGIDVIKDLVVTFNGTCGLSCLKGAMERVLRNSTELLRHQHNIRKYAQLFSYGLEQNRYRYADAFAATLVTIRHYLYSLQDG